MTTFAVWAASVYSSDIEVRLWPLRLRTFSTLPPNLLRLSFRTFAFSRSSCVLRWLCCISMSSLIASSFSVLARYFFRLVLISLSIFTCFYTFC